MMKRYNLYTMLHTVRHLLLLLTLSGVISLPAASQNSEESQSVGLVLSGGGAKGIAHIGVIQALEDNNIPIDYITGTSMGSIVGGLYACGYTPAEMMELIKSAGFARWSTGQIDPALTYRFSQPEQTPAMLTLNIGTGDSINSSSPVLPSSLISPLPMNLAFMEIFAPYTAQCHGDFNRLFVPFRCVCSDITAKRKKVMGSGSVGDAIRASMNFPIVFHPIDDNGNLLYDGGIYENYPIETMRQVFAPGIMIGVNVSSSDSKPSENETIMDQLEAMIIQRQDYTMPPRHGINLKINLSEFGLLDWSKAQEIYNIGYRYAREHMDSIKIRVKSRISPEARKLRREVFKSKTPALVFNKINVTGGSQSQNKLLTSLFRTKNDTIGINGVRNAYYRAISPGNIRNMTINTTFNDTTHLFDLKINASIKDNLTLGVGGFITSSTSSMLFLSAAYRTLSFHSLDLSFNGWLGQSYMAGQLKARMSIIKSQPAALTLEAIGSRQKFYQSDKLFTNFNQPSFVQTDEMFARIYAGTAAGRNGVASLGFGGGHMVDRYYADLSEETPHRHVSTRNLMQITGRMNYSTLNSEICPVNGAFYTANLIAATGNYKLEGAGDADGKLRRSFLQAELKTRNYWDLNKYISIGLESNIILSTRHLLKTFYSTMVDAPEFYPCGWAPSVFDPDLRSYNYLAAGAMPIWKISSVVQLRTSAWCYAPLRQIKQTEIGGAARGRWFGVYRFLGETAIVANLRSVTVTGYARYVSTPATRWAFGITLGTYLIAPKFLR